MEPEERRRRADRLREIIDSTDPGTWIDGQLADIEAKRAGSPAAATGPAYR